MEAETRREILIQFGKRLKEVRVEKGLSYRKLAQLCDVDHSQISKIEKGQVDVQISTAFELARGLGVEVVELFRV